MLNSSYDAIGINRDWHSSISVDKRSIIKKFFRDSGPQFLKIREDFLIEEFCRRLKAVSVAPGAILKET